MNYFRLSAEDRDELTLEENFKAWAAQINAQSEALISRRYTDAAILRPRPVRTAAESSAHKFGFFVVISVIIIILLLLLLSLLLFFFSSLLLLLLLSIIIVVAFISLSS